MSDLYVDEYICCPVQSKLECVLDTEIQFTESNKRPGQKYKVVASNDLNQNAKLSDVFATQASEKVDGTCCYVGLREEKIELFARLDRKPHKKASKRFKSYTNQLLKCDDMEEKHSFAWKYPDDFKPVSEHWIPARNLRTDEYGIPCPDKNGHTPGWVPISVDPNQYCWHNATIDDVAQLALVLQPAKSNKSNLVITLCSLPKMLDYTYELIGTCINGNPYMLGSKKAPFHILIKHGSLPIHSLPPNLTVDSLKHWFDDKEITENKLEGLVWHCSNGNLFKLHRHHLGLPWPFGNDSMEPFLCKRSVKVSLETEKELIENSKFKTWLQFDGKQFKSLVDLAGVINYKLN